MTRAACLCAVLITSVQWLSPHYATAQSPGSLSPVPPPPPPAAGEFDVEVTELRLDESSFALRIPAELLGAVMGVLVPAIGGLIIGGVATAGCDGAYCDLEAGAIGILVGGFAAIFTIPGGITLGGDLAGGNGGYGWALLGNLIGAGVGTAAIAGAAAQDEQTFIGPTVIFAIMSYLAGGVLGYELSSRPDTSRVHVNPNVAPVLGPTVDAQGLSIGVLGVL